MIVLADNDVIHKLACCELLRELLQWLGVPPNQVWILPTLLYVIRKKLKGNAPALNNFNAFISQTQTIPPADPAILEKFSVLDVGEQQLLAVFVDNSHNCSRLMTGDKRALKLVAELATRDTDLNPQLNGRVDSLEGIMLGLIGQFGFEAVNKKVSRCLKIDTVLSVAFGEKRTEGNAISALTSYLADLRRTAPFIVQR